MFRRVGGSDEDERRNRAGGEKETYTRTTRLRVFRVHFKPSRRGDRLEKDAEPEAVSRAFRRENDENETDTKETSDERAWRRSATTHVPNASRVTALRFASKSSRVLRARSSSIGRVVAVRRASDDAPRVRVGDFGLWRLIWTRLAAHVLARVRLADKTRHGVSLAHHRNRGFRSAVGAFPPRAFAVGPQG